MARLCNFCGEPNHYIRECLVVDEYIAQGKVRRDPQGRVVLSTGAFVPRGVPGRWLRDRVNEWHRQNPNQLNAAQLVYGVYQNRAHVQNYPPRAPTNTYAISAEERLATMEREMYNIRRAQAQAPFQPVIRTRQQRINEEAQRTSSEEASASTSANRAPTPQVAQPARAPHAEQVYEPPVHPYANARDATVPTPTTVPAPVPAACNGAGSRCAGT